MSGLRRLTGQTHRRAVGDADQFIKGIFHAETASVTHDAVRFAPGPEIATPWLSPDGILTWVRRALREGEVIAPWTLFCFRAVVDFKMEGDHLDAVALARVELRRLAAWVQSIEGDEAEDPTAPQRYATLVVAPHLPEWLASPPRRGPLTLEGVSPGCYLIGPRDHAVVWVAANELPLHESLVPFLWARSGRSRVEFVRWLAGVRGVPSVVAVIQRHPMGAQIAKQLVETPEEQEVIRQRGLEMARILFEGYPEFANEVRRDAEEKGVEQGVESTLVRLFSRRLARTLTREEHATLTARIATLGVDRVGEVVLNDDADALARWLADPDAR